MTPIDSNIGAIEHWVFGSVAAWKKISKGRNGATILETAAG